MPTSPLLPGARHKFAPPSFLSAACHARRAQHLVHRSLLASIHFAGHLAIYGFIHGSLRMFRLSFFILDSLPPSLASHLSSLPSAIDLCRSWRPRARCRASISHSVAAFILNAGLLSHTTPRDLSLAGLDSTLLSPISLSVVYTVSLRTRTRQINTQACFAEKQATAAPVSPFHLACVSGHLWPNLVSFSSLFVFLVSLTVRSDFSYRHSPPPSAKSCILLFCYQLTPRI